MLGAAARRTIFWALDAFKGRPIGNHVQDIKAIMSGERMAFSTLPQLLQHAIDTVPYYEGMPATAISAFPIVDKETYRTKRTAFLSSAFDSKALHRTSTSGSTGVPLDVFQDPDKRNRNAADLIYFHRERGWNIGERFVFLRAWTRLHAKPKLSHFKQNSIPVDVIHFGDAEKEQLRTRLKSDKQIGVILGYASALEGFLAYLLSRGDDASMFHLRVIISDSDALSPHTKSALERMFNCPVIDRYSNEEQGLIACTRPFESVYEVNRASYFLELLKLNADEPAEPGETGRVVITDLFNLAMPLIRYDTGDLAVSDDPDRAGLHTLRSLQGRISDLLLDTSGHPVSAVILSATLDDFPGIGRYQCIQTGAGQFTVKVVTEPGFDEDPALLDRLRTCLGEKAQIDLEHVDDIPNAPNGKFKTTIYSGMGKAITPPCFEGESSALMKKQADNAMLESSGPT